jgi:hypothetical protein
VPLLCFRVARHSSSITGGVPSGIKAALEILQAEPQDGISLQSADSPVALAVYSHCHGNVKRDLAGVVAGLLAGPCLHPLSDLVQCCTNSGDHIRELITCCLREDRCSNATTTDDELDTPSTTRLIIISWMVGGFAIIVFTGLAWVISRPPLLPAGRRSCCSLRMAMSEGIHRNEVALLRIAL